MLGTLGTCYVLFLFDNLVLHVILFSDQALVLHLSPDFPFHISFFDSQ